MTNVLELATASNPAARLRATARPSGEPDWEPLLALVGDELAGWFTWAGTATLEDGGELHRYRHAVTRRHLELARDGRAFAREFDQLQPGRELTFTQITRATAIRRALVSWPQLDGYERGKHEPLIEAATARASAGARFWVDPAELERCRRLDARLVAAFGPGFGCDDAAGDRLPLAA